MLPLVSNSLVQWRKPTENIPSKLRSVEGKKLIHEQYFNAAFIIPILLQQTFKNKIYCPVYFDACSTDYLVTCHKHGRKLPPHRSIKNRINR